MKKFFFKHWLLIISILYLIWPFDLISDTFGPLGLIDDAGLLLAAVIREIFIYYRDKNSLPDKPNK